MKNILIINKNPQDTERTTALALLLAGTTNTKLYFWNAPMIQTHSYAAEMSVAVANKILPARPVSKHRWIEQLQRKFYLQTGLKTLAEFIENIHFVSDNIAAIVRKFNIGLLIKGIPENADQELPVIESDVLSCSAKSGCPVLLVPEQFPYKTLEKIVYATDLRYCRQGVIRFLSKLAINFNASVLIANIAAKGLPFMEHNYALDVFKDTIAHPASHDHFHFNNIWERDIPKAIDILANDMNTDLLVLVNHRYHFNELFGAAIPYRLPAYIRIPVLLFPC
ncbi:hypothetical protein [Mucilaginibacter sp.]|jgi:hypothetical protein|uniref:hypothetical protein n=1 Tax=Mucilaginibacter sp. TaxID=1882438 RepID=UPI002D7F66D3|nr:hypothetical protein [Mucilaginibacter sp.]